MENIKTFKYPIERIFCSNNRSVIAIYINKIKNYGEITLLDAYYKEFYKMSDNNIGFMRFDIDGKKFAYSVLGGNCIYIVNLDSKKIIKKVINGAYFGIGNYMSDDLSHIVYANGANVGNIDINNRKITYMKIPEILNVLCFGKNHQQIVANTMVSLTGSRGAVIDIKNEIIHPVAPDILFANLSFNQKTLICWTSDSKIIEINLANFKMIRLVEIELLQIRTKLQPYRINFFKKNIIIEDILRKIYILDLNGRLLINISESSFDIGINNLFMSIKNELFRFNELNIPIIEKFLR